MLFASPWQPVHCTYAGKLCFDAMHPELSPVAIAESRRSLRAEQLRQAILEFVG